MYKSDPLLGLLLIGALRAERIHEASLIRQVSPGRPSRPNPVRRAIGRSFIDFGERLAAEPPAKPARSV